MERRDAVDLLLYVLIFVIVLVMMTQITVLSDRIDTLEQRLRVAERNVTDLAWECLGDPMEDDALPEEAAQ